jgi:hypothetical protein
VSPQAAARLQEVLTAQHRPPGYGVKVVPSQAGPPRPTIAAPRAGEAVVRRRADAAPLLIVDGRLTAALDGTELDCRPAAGASAPRAGFTRRPRPTGGPAGSARPGPRRPHGPGGP